VNTSLGSCHEPVSPGWVGDIQNNDNPEELPQ
jgi:hypothetical protein